MKTFETEKHNIPGGATHYWNETRHSKFAWWDDINKLMLCPDNEDCWVCGVGDNEMHKIPKIKGLEWNNGDECLYLNERECVFIGMRMDSDTHCIIETKNSKTYMPVNVSEISKPEVKGGLRRSLKDELDSFIQYASQDLIKGAHIIDCDESNAKFISIGSVNGYTSRLKRAIQDDHFRLWFIKAMSAELQEEPNK